MKLNEDVARAIKTIERDISDRSGLGDVWDSIDELTKEEIRAAWGFAITQAINSAIGKMDLSEVWREYSKPRP